MEYFLTSGTSATFQHLYILIFYRPDFYDQSSCTQRIPRSIAFAPGIDTYLTSTMRFIYHLSTIALLEYTCVSASHFVTTRKALPSMSLLARDTPSFTSSLCNLSPANGAPPYCIGGSTPVFTPGPKTAKAFSDLVTSSTGSPTCLNQADPHEGGGNTCVPNPSPAPATTQPPQSSSSAIIVIGPDGSTSTD